MSVWYVYPGAVGANNGTSTTDAWTTVRSALTSGSVAGGDIVYCRGNETISTVINVSVAAWASPYAPYQFIGVNSSWVVDGTNYTISAGAASFTIINAVTSADGLSFKNFTLNNPTAYASVVGIATRDYGILWNCTFANLYQGAAVRNVCIVKSCYFSSCSNYGAKSNTTYPARYINSRFDSCGTGIITYGHDLIAGSVFSNCTYGISHTTGTGTYPIFVSQSTFYNDTYGVYVTTNSAYIQNCLFVSCGTYSISINSAGYLSYEIDNVYYPSQNNSVNAGATLFAIGTTTVLGADPLQNAAGGNFMPSSTAGGMANALSLGDGTNYTYVDAGLQRHDTGTSSTSTSVTIVFI
jgi:hypothetical protein